MITLVEEESELLKQLLLMTGREDRLARKPFVENAQIAGIRAIWPILKSATEGGRGYEARSDLLNRLLLTLGIMTTSIEFFRTVFRDVDFSKFEDIVNRVNDFRTLCMLEYGSFRYGYKQLRQGSLIEEKWARYFPTESEATARADRLKTSPAPVGLIPINASRLFALGYLASEQAEKINKARKTLGEILQKSIDKKVIDFKGVQSVSVETGTENLTSLMASAGVPGTEALVYPDLPLFGPQRTFSDILISLRETCVAVDEDAIRDTQSNGLQNARTYMAMHDLNLYVATSMREPLHFTTNWAFVQGLFHSGYLADWNLRYFDPTQAFLPDRIQKGLLECLMIKRAQLTVYNAQEADTFGKDSEAGVTLAQAKPVVVFVARLFDKHPEMTKLTAAIDQAARCSRDEFAEALRDIGLLSAEETKLLLGPEKSKADAIDAVVHKHAAAIMTGIGEDHVGMELIRQGYDPVSSAMSVIDFAVERILRLERRALTFRDVHPLALQTSPMDGVARGVIVTRTVEDTARVVSGLLRGTLKYEIINAEANWLLVDSITRSPVRVVTKDPVLTSAFWSESWGTEC
jgi:hypothetical protein